MSNLTNRQIKSLIKQTIATYRKSWVANPNDLAAVSKFNVLSQLLVDIEALESK